jgi:fused signal recognition particle receptor
MFGFIKKSFTNFFSGLGSRLKSIFSTDNSGKLNLTELETLLLESDVGNEVCQKLLHIIKTQEHNRPLGFEQLKASLEQELLTILNACGRPDLRPKILMLVGVNGAGKTTFTAKFANLLKNENKKTLLVAGDTFRAAAADQIKEWANRLNLEIVQGKTDQDPASVVFAGADKFVREGFDQLIIDTAGRLHTKANLMAELQKIRNVLAKKLGSEQKVTTWLVLDAMLGQSSINQAENFHHTTKLDGLVITKCDASARAGAIFAIAQRFSLPVMFMSNGQGLEDLEAFDAPSFVRKFLG